MFYATACERTYPTLCFHHVLRLDSKPDLPRIITPSLTICPIPYALAPPLVTYALTHKYIENVGRRSCEWHSRLLELPSKHQHPQLHAYDAGTHRVLEEKRAVYCYVRR